MRRSPASRGPVPGQGEADAWAARTSRDTTDCLPCLSLRFALESAALVLVACKRAGGSEFRRMKRSQRRACGRYGGVDVCSAWAAWPEPRPAPVTVGTGPASSCVQAVMRSQPGRGLCGHARWPAAAPRWPAAGTRRPRLSIVAEVASGCSAGRRGHRLIDQGEARTKSFARGLCGREMLSAVQRSSRSLSRSAIARAERAAHWSSVAQASAASAFAWVPGALLPRARGLGDPAVDERPVRVRDRIPGGIMIPGEVRETSAEGPAMSSACCIACRKPSRLIREGESLSAARSGRSGGGALEADGPAEQGQALVDLVAADGQLRGPPRPPDGLGAQVLRPALRGPARPGRDLRAGRRGVMVASRAG